jgi:orotate phosphoribosyltransferase
MRLRRFPAPEGMRFAVIEDVVTTGGSVREVGEALEILGGKWEASGCIVDRTTQDVQLPVELLSLTKKTFPVYKPEECPFCKKGYPLVKPGSRKR